MARVRVRVGGNLRRGNFPWGNFPSTNKRSKKFNFKTFKVVLLATINSIIVTALLLLNLYTVLLQKIYDPRRKLNVLIKFQGILPW